MYVSFNFDPFPQFYGGVGYAQVAQVAVTVVTVEPAAYMPCDPLPQGVTSVEITLPHLPHIFRFQWHIVEANLALSVVASAGNRQ